MWVRSIQRLVEPIATILPEMNYWFLSYFVIIKLDLASTIIPAYIAKSTYSLHIRSQKRKVKSKSSELKSDCYQ